MWLEESALSWLEVQLFMWKSGALAPRPPAGTLKGSKPQWSPFQFFETERLKTALRSFERRS
jgi:hypothetical protein